MRNNKKHYLIYVILLLSCVLTGCMKGKEIKTTDSISPIIDQDGADPYVLKHGDVYYYTKTTGNNITLIRSDNLSGISAGEICVLYEPMSELENLWAPEIFYLDEVWYVYFAANVPGEEMHHMYVLINENSDPFEGDWKCEPVAGMDDKFAIDGTVFEVESRRYFVWSGWEGYENICQNLYLAEMITPTEVMEEKILLSSPEFEWEIIGNPWVNEGPEIIIKEDTINLVYSASGSWTDDYCLGLLTADKNNDLKLPESWKKEDVPIFSSENDVWGPGHCSFTTSADGTENIVVYHAARWQGAGWNRSVRFTYANFDETGKMMPMEPEPSDELLKLPSGETVRQVYLADNFNLGTGIERKEEPGSISEEVAEGFIDTKEKITLNIQGEKEGSAILYIYAKFESFYDPNDIVGVQVEINNEEYNTLLYPSDYFQPVSFKVVKGINEVVISSEAGGSVFAIDRVEVEQN